VVSYREHAPPPALAPWVECVWERRGEGRPPVRVVPDGCIDVVWIEGAGTHVAGPNTVAFLVELPAGARVAGARMHPGAATALLGVEPAAVLDARALVAGVLGDDGRRLADRLDGDEDRVRTLFGFLTARAAGAPAPDPLVRAAVTRLGDPETRVAALAGDLAVSERHLRRRVEALVGYGPKRLARILRLRRALDAARRGDELARIAAETGYADQAHFAQDCRALAGVPPTRLLAA
jgi:AraC-like DNA-binding protein